MENLSASDDRLKSASDQVGGDKILSGNVAGSVAAIGAGANVIYNKVERTLSETESLEQAQEFENKRLARALTDYVQRLERQAALVKEDPGYGNPYKALLEFDIQDAALFYGRTIAIREILTRIKRDQLTILHAGSGVGKTSLLKAGIMPRLLADGHLPLYVRPYQTSVHRSVKETLLGNLEETPRLATFALHDFLRRATDLMSGGQLVVIVDQFEELFTVQNEQARNEFVDQLSACLDDDLLPVRWIIGLRDEWFGQLGTFRPHLRNPYANEFLLRPLSRAEATLVITQPAARRQVSYELPLVERLLDDMGKDEIAPPHLQLVCSMLFDSLDGATEITQAMYEEAGQTKGILRGYLDRVLSRDMPSDMQAPAHRLLEALVTSEKRRALRTREELTTELSAWGYPASIVDKVLNQLTDSRLLRVEEFMLDKLHKVAAYELAHDYLLEEVDIDPETQARKAAQELLTQKVPHYKREKLLLSPHELAIILPQRKWLTLSDEAASLLRESEAVATRERRIRRAAIAAAVLLLIMTIAAFAFQQKQSADRYEMIASTAFAAEEHANREAKLASAAQALAEIEARASRSGELAAEAELAKNLGEVISAYQLAADSYQTARILSSRSALFSALSLPLPERIFRLEEDVADMATFNPQGDRIVTVGSDDVARIWDSKNGEELFRLDIPEAITFAVFNPDGTRIVTATSAGTVGIWDAKDGQQIQNFLAHEDGIRSAVFSPDGSLIVTASEDGTGAIWDAEDGSKVATLEGHEREVTFAAFSPDGSHIVTSSEDSTVRIWGVDGREILILEGHKARVDRAGFSPDGSRIVSASEDRTARIWDAETGETLAFLVPHDSDVNSAEFSMDGLFIITTSEDRLVRLWDAEDGILLAVFPGHTDQVNWASFSPDGKWILTASNDSSVWLRDTRKIGGSNSFIGHTHNVNSVQFSKNGTRFVTASADFSARVWDPQNSEPLFILQGHERGVRFAAISPNGTRVVTASSDETVRVWNALNGDELYQIDVDALSVNFSPDGTKIVSAGTDNLVRVWNAQSGEELLPALAGHLDEVNYASFSPDGTHIVTAAGGDDDGTVRIWDADTHEQLAEFPIIADNEVNAASFSPDGKRLAIAADDSIAEVWDIDRGERVLQLVGHSTDVRSAHFSPDGRLIVTASGDHTVRLWDAETGEELAVMRGHTDEVKWAAFSPDGRWIFSASNDRTVRTWMANFDDLYNFIRDELIRLGIQ